MLAWRNLKFVPAGRKVSTWLYRIATNCWLMHARKRKEELLGDRDDAIADDDNDDMPHPSPKPPATTRARLRSSFISSGRCGFKMVKMLNFKFH